MLFNSKGFYVRHRTTKIGQNLDKRYRATAVTTTTTAAAALTTTAVTTTTTTAAAALTPTAAWTTSTDGNKRQSNYLNIRTLATVDSNHHQK